VSEITQGSIAVVVPCYRVGSRVLPVLKAIPLEVNWIICIDDACPMNTGELIKISSKDPRIRVIQHTENQGVGGATMTGYLAALELGAEVVVKLDGDGQMDPALIPRFAQPIQDGIADYSKGNRFHFPRNLKRMPWMRLIGNAALSFATKLSTGYWNLFDPNNGYTAIHASVLRELPLERISRRYFFESDMLFRLNLMHAVVMDVPMESNYGDEESGLNIPKIVPTFLWGHLRNTFKRIAYNYFLRDFNVASLAGILGIGLLAFGTSFGLMHWLKSVHSGVTASSGTVMLSALPVIIGIELLLSGLNHDVSSVPHIPIQRALYTRESPRSPTKQERVGRLRIDSSKNEE